MPERACYFASEIAELLGMSLDHFYRSREKLHAAGMPPSTPGKLRIHKATFDAWLKRPVATVAPANDDDPDVRARLAAAYRRAEHAV